MSFTIHTFHSSERLKSKKQIQELFEKGSSFYLSFIKIRYILKDSSPALPQVIFIVPSKGFKKAVDRNWIKRRMREAYRINKYKWSDEAVKPAIISFIFIGKQKESFAEIEKQIVKIFEYNWKKKN